MTKLSVNINKVATLRNSRGGVVPDVIQVAMDCEKFGADGITVHPRPDERHITKQDVLDLTRVLTTEFNIEGYPDERYMDLVKRVKPAQATLVPDPPEALTSSAGWDTVSHESFLREIVQELKSEGIRTSIFVDPSLTAVQGAAQIGADRIELYTESYAKGFMLDKEGALAPYVECAKIARELGLGLNAGHDLDLENLAFFDSNVLGLDEVSIGHALISDSLYMGLANAIRLYQKQLGN